VCVKDKIDFFEKFYDITHHLITPKNMANIANIANIKNIIITDSDSESDDETIVEKKDCEICCDTKFFLIACPYCSYEACETCYQRVVLSSITKPSCVSCKKQFNEDFFYENFSDSFIKKKYKKHRENVLFKIEEALLPETQPHVERIKKCEKLQDEFYVIKMQIAELKKKQDLIRQKIRNIQDEDIKDGDSDDEKIVMCPCPVNDCRGYVNNKYRCGICEVKACSQCREVKEKEHKCDPNTVKTVEELKKNCKNCPNCMTPIYKISGCDQMFCVKCKVAFDWKTGKVESGLIHNPHYFEWLRDNGGVPRNPHNRECGGLVDAHVIYTTMSGLVDMYVDENITLYQYIMNLYRECLHIQEVILPRLPTVMDNQSNRDLRIEYLMKKIDKDEFMKKIQKREHDNTKLIEYRQIVEMYYNVFNDLLNKLVHDKTRTNVDTFQAMSLKFVDDEKRIKEYTNNEVKKLKKKYGSRSIHEL
jgi:hypothetical protein